MSDTNPELKETFTSIAAPVVVPTEDDDLIDDHPAEVAVDESSKVEAKVKQHVKLNSPVFTESKWVEDQETVALPTNFDAVSITALNKTPNVSLTDSTESKRWAEIIKGGLSLTAYDSAFIKTLEDDDAEFGQTVEHNGTALKGGHPKFPKTENEIMKGERGILRFMAHQGMGNMYRTPLWHSGFWITFKAPSDGALLELHRQMVADKIEMGRETYGLAYSNIVSYTADRLLSFALEHVYETSLNAEELKSTDLKTLISCHDIPSVIHGLLCAIYSKGFQYSRACVTDPAKCNHISEGRLDLPKIQFVNKRGLSTWQLSHMSERRANSKSLDSIKRYKEELLKCQNRTFELSNIEGRITNVTLKIPTAAEYIDSGHRWIGDIVSMVNRILGLEATDKDRNDYIGKHGSATAMRTYSHWVDSIEFDSNKIEDRETLEGIFNVMSSEDETRDKFTKEVIKYIDETAIVVVGIPVYDCPACGSTQESQLKNTEFTNIIPVDIYQVFFALLVQRLRKVVRR